MELDESLLDLFGDDEPDGLHTVNKELWEKMQERTFTAWCNSRLKQCRKSIKNRLADDLSDGVLLVGLLEILSERKIEDYHREPKNKFEKLDNCQKCFALMKDEGIKLVAIGNSDIVEGTSSPLILGLIWKIIRHYQIDKTVPTVKEAFPEEEKPLHPLLAWVQSKIPEKNITNFTSDWRSGINIAALVNAIQPGLCREHAQMNKSTPIENARLAMERARIHLGVPMVLDPADLVHQRNNVYCIMTYIAGLREAKLMTDFKAFIDLRASVSEAREYHKSEAQEVMHAVLCGQECSLDSMVSALAHSYFNEQANLKFNQTSSVLIPLFNQRRADVIFCTEAAYLFTECDVESTRVTCIDDVDLTALQADGRLKLTLVNHNQLPLHQRHLVPDVVEILDHHEDKTEDVYEPTLPIWVDPDVACTSTLIAECYLDQLPHLLEENPEIVVLLLGAILYTTENLTSKTTRERDRDAAERLGKKTSVNRDALYTNLVQHASKGGPPSTAYDVLCRDYKEADEAPRGVQSGGSTLIRESLEAFLARPDAQEALRQFCHEKDLALLLLVSHCSDENETVKRKLGVYKKDADSEMIGDVEEYLQTRDDLKLSLVDGTEGLCMRIFCVENLSPSLRDIALCHIVDFLKTKSLPPLSPHSNVMWLSGHHDGIPIIVCAACYLPETSLPDYDSVMDQLYRFCYQFVKNLRCKKFIAVYLYGGTDGKDVEKYRWMRQWYFMLTKRFYKKLHNVYLVHCGVWTERLLKFAGLFMNQRLYEKLVFNSTIEELSHFLDVNQINFPPSVIREDRRINGRQDP